MIFVISPVVFIIYFYISVIVLTSSSLQEQAMTLGIYVMENNLWDLLIFILLKMLCNYVWVSHTRHKKGTLYYYVIIELLKMFIENDIMFLSFFFLFCFTRDLIQRLLQFVITVSWKLTGDQRPWTDVTAFYQETNGTHAESPVNMVR